MSQLSKVEPDKEKLWRFSQLNYSNILSQPAYQRSPTSFLPNSYSRTFFYIFMHKFTLVRKHNIHDTCFDIVFLPETGISPLLFPSIRYMGHLVVV